MPLKKEFHVKKKCKINTFSARKNFFMKNILIITFLKKADFTGLFKRIVHSLSKSYIDLSGFNNPEGENKSNRAKTERFYIMRIFTKKNFHKNPRSLHVKPYLQNYAKMWSFFDVI